MIYWKTLLETVDIRQVSPSHHHGCFLQNRAAYEYPEVLSSSTPVIRQHAGRYSKSPPEDIDSPSLP